MDQLRNKSNGETTGLLAAVLAQMSWGLLPVYWKWLGQLAPYQILVHRILWSALFLHLLLWVQQGKNHSLNLLRNREVRWQSIFGGIFVSINWLIYIWSVNSGRILESSLGYYILPLVTGLFGYFLGERFNQRQWLAFAFATLGVLVQIVALGYFPLFSFLIAFSFSSYTVIKKHNKLNALDSLYLETMYIAPLALIYLVWTEFSGAGISGNLAPSFWLRMATTGIITASPLLLYGYGTRSLPLRMTAFIQYLNPSLSLLIGVWFYHEAFHPTRMLSFVFIWIGVEIFTWDQVRRHQRSKSGKTG